MIAGKPGTMAKLGTAFLTWRRHLQRELVPYGITLKQTYVLRQLTRNEYLRPSQIAEMLFSDRPTATVVIRNMKKNGWVEKQRDPDNAKMVRVTITSKGRSKLQAVGKAQKARTGHGFDPVGCFSARERRQLDALLDRMHAHLARLPSGGI